MKKRRAFVVIAFLFLISLVAFAYVHESTDSQIEHCPRCWMLYLYPPEAVVGTGKWRYQCTYCGACHEVSIEEPQDTTAIVVPER
jgi:hypothetical protein